MRTRLPKGLLVAMTLAATLLWLGWSFHAAQAVGGSNSINGLVTAGDTGQALSQVCVTAHQTGSAQSTFTTTTDTFGAYEITGLPSADYRVEFVDCLAQQFSCLPPQLSFLSEWYNQRPDEQSADTVSVTGGEKTGAIDAALTRAATPGAGPTPTATPTPQLTWTMGVDPPSPQVGDGVQVRAAAAGNGGLPAYTLMVNSAGDGPALRLDDPPTMDANMLGETVLWHLTALRAGEATVQVSVNYERPSCFCTSRDSCHIAFSFTTDTSPVVNIAVNEAPVLRGDANGDGRVDAIDAALVLQFTAGLIGSVPGNGDANGDGTVNAVDAALILQYSAGLLLHL